MSATFNAEHKDDSEVLHYNTKEKNYTLYGIYPYTKLKSWRKARYILDNSSSIKQASRVVAKDEVMYQEVLGFYYENFYRPLGLDYVESDLKAKEIMLFMINVGMGRRKRAVKAIQRIVGTKVDGIFGVMTIHALNEFPDELFSNLWDKYEISFYERLVKIYPRLKWALRGWRNRAKLV